MINRAGQPEKRQVVRISPEVGVDRAHVGLLQAEAVLDPEKAKIHVQDLPERRGFRKDLLAATAFLLLPESDWVDLSMAGGGRVRWTGACFRPQARTVNILKAELNYYKMVRNNETKKPPYYREAFIKAT